MPQPTPAIAITMGDPLGVGPEVVVKALADAGTRAAGRFRIYGQSATLEWAAERAGVDPPWSGRDRVTVVEIGVAPRNAAGTGPSRDGGEASFQFVERAIADTKRPADDPDHAAAIVTAPISKEGWALAGFRDFPGHTELLASRYAATRVRMMFFAPRLRVMLVTTHVPLAHVPALLTFDRVLETIELAAEMCLRLGLTRPRIAVCGVNPHAGEAGLLGDDEVRTLTPAIRAAQDRGIDANGPFPADTIFNAALEGAYDLVVAMYHDQGLIPVKLLAFDQAVNLTAGLPIIRTSPDHGTAFDIAGKNLANPGSMRAAIHLAARLASTAR